MKAVVVSFSVGEIVRAARTVRGGCNSHVLAVRGELLRVQGLQPGRSSIEVARVDGVGVSFFVNPDELASAPAGNTLPA